jgi:hypothetical protein
MKHFALIAVAALWLGGCGQGRHVQRGANEYRSADYSGAMTEWRYLEDREDDLNDKGRVRYLVFRGLTHYRLYQQGRHPGEAGAALHFLARGKLAYDAGKAGWLNAKTVVEMKDALAELAGSPPQAAGQVIVVQLPEAAPQTVIVPMPASPPAPAEDEDEDD